MALSGSAFTPWAFHLPGQARRQARVLAEHTKCPATPSDAFLACLRTRTAEEVTTVDERFFQWDISPHMPFKATAEPAGEGAFLEMHPRDAYGAGLVHDDVPFMTGLTAQDGAISVTGEGTAKGETTPRSNVLYIKNSENHKKRSQNKIHKKIRKVQRN